MTSGVLELYLRHRKQKRMSVHVYHDIYGQIWTKTDINGHCAIPIYYICNVKQKLTIYEKHFNEHGCKPNVGRPPNLPE